MAFFWTEVPWRPSQRAISFSKLYCTCTWETSHILNWDRWITDHCAMGRAVAHSFRRKVWTLIVKSHCGELWNAIDHQLSQLWFGCSLPLKSHFKSSLLEASCLKEILWNCVVTTYFWKFLLFDHWVFISNKFHFIYIDFSST